MTVPHCKSDGAPSFVGRASLHFSRLTVSDLTSWSGEPRTLGPSTLARVPCGAYSERARRRFAASPRHCSQRDAGSCSTGSSPGPGLQATGDLDEIWADIQACLFAAIVVVVLDHGRALCAWNVERRPMHRHEAASGRD